MSTLLENVHAVLSITPERWRQLVNTLPFDLLACVPATGEWSALTCLQHVLTVECRVYPVRVRAFLHGEPIDALEHLLDDERKTPDELVEVFTSERSRNLALLMQLTEHDLKRTVLHRDLGIIELAQLLYTWAGHDLMHLVQAERALMQPFMSGSGPCWQAIFWDHEIQPKENQEIALRNRLAQKNSAS